MHIGNAFSESSYYYAHIIALLPKPFSTIMLTIILSGTKYV